MPSKKKQHTRAAQLHPQPAPQSDYDTDTGANITDTAGAASMAPPPARTNTELNLLVLRRYVPDIERIISIAPFAVVYLFSPETQAWEKSGTEGTLFVCQLNGTARYNVVILNRKSLDNFITDLVSGEDIEITEEYVILQVPGEDGQTNIYGLWIFSDETEGNGLSTREVVANAIQECAVRAEYAGVSTNGHHEEDEYEATAPYNLDGSAEDEERDMPVQQPTQSAGQQIDLLSLFGKPSEPTPSMQQRQTMMSPPVPQPPPPTRFASTADTDFFRTSHNPADATQPQPQPPPARNALLDLFKSAKKG